MHFRWLIWVAVCFAALAGACSASDAETSGGSTAGGSGASSGGSSGSQGPIDVPIGGGSTDPGDQNIAAMRIEPEDGELVIAPGETATQAYRVFATMEGSSTEKEITERSVFYVPDNWQVGGFVDNGPTFETASEEPRGGVLTVSAQAANSDGSVSEVKTSLTVRVIGTALDPRDDGSGDFDVPADAAGLFADATADEARAPQLVYPNDDVLLPPNLRKLEVHFRPGADNNLFEVAFESALTELTYYVRCGVPMEGGCVFELDQETYRYLAYGNRGTEPVQLTVRGMNDAGTAVGTSQQFALRFTKEEVNGGLYYWSTSTPPAIMRFDFGRTDTAPEVFLEAQGTYGDTTIAVCIGCHALSRDGTKMLASLGGENWGRLVYLNDLSTARSEPQFFDRYDDTANRLQFGSFNPDGSRFVAVYGDTNASTDERLKLWIHDGDSGVRLPEESIPLEFEPDHPDWSPDGEMIAFSRVKASDTTSQRAGSSGIELIRRTGGAWSAPETIIEQDDSLNQFNPNFVPDSSFFVYSVTSCSGAAIDCDGDADPSTSTWAVLPSAGATPVHLQRAGAPGVADNGITNLGDTFPRSAPFENSYDQGRVYWVTIASRRWAGLRGPAGKLWLWMFAIDPDAVAQGKDGSFPAFVLPFQDLETSNHIGQWTQKIVSDEPPPAPAPPPPVPPPPPPPR